VAPSGLHEWGGARARKYIAAERRRLPAAQEFVARSERARGGPLTAATHQPDGRSEGASTSPCRIAFASRMISRQDNNST